MGTQNFIFSEKKGDRIKRHLLFWFILGVYFALLQAANPLLTPPSAYINNLPSAFIRSFLLLVPQFFTAYAILYIVVPLYIWKRKLLLVFLSLLIIWIFSAAINIQMSININPPVLKWILPQEYYRDLIIPKPSNPIIGLFSVNKGVFTGAGFLVMLRYLKEWYLKDRRNLQLQKENAQSQLQLLTAQVHPHFLFNTLNNIYSQTQTESPRGSKMIMELSDMLRYILAEGNKSLVPLNKELKMLKEYLNIEKIKYGSRLEVFYSFPDDTGKLMIAPLLLLPFVENSFIHSVGNLHVDKWVNLEITIQGKQLYMKLLSGKTSDEQNNGIQPEMGIANVNKRLELLYQDRHELKITDENDVLVISLYLELSNENTELIQDSTGQLKSAVAG